jgi:cobalt-zinc-cadmium efflux system membrane fusion protein
MKTRGMRWWALAFGLLVFIAGGWWVRSRGRTPEAPPAEAAKTGLQLPKAALAENPIATTRVDKVKLAPDLQIVGSVAFDEDHYAIVGPLVGGRVVRLAAGLGDAVKRGQVLAEVESAEVGQAQAAYLAARAKARAAEANATRERDLAQQRISSVRDRELAEAQAVSENAELKAATERLRAFGLNETDLRTLESDNGGTGGRVPLRAPIAGTVVMRAVTLGQAVERATDAYKLVDLQHLWVLLDLYEKDLERVRVGQKVELRADAYPGEVFRAHVGWVNPLVDAKTRTANVRIELGNPDGKLRPGQFVTARLLGDANSTPVEVLAVQRKAVATVEGKPLVFVRAGSGWERRSVELGWSAGDLVEVRKGLSVGDEVVSEGAFLLKSELLR